MKALTSREDADPEKSCNAVRSQFTHQHGQMGPNVSSATLRKRVLNEFHRTWKDLSSTNTCFSCLCNPPEHVLPCHHSICDMCVVIFGLASKTAEYHYDVIHCPICGENAQTVVRQLPPTKRPVVMSLDGGGIRGVIQLGLLRSLENKIGNNISLPHIIDLWAGTSVGQYGSQSFIGFIFASI